MAGKSPDGVEVLGAKLDAILNALQDLVIIEGSRGGLSKAEVRKMLGVGDARVSEVWKHLTKVKPE